MGGSHIELNNSLVLVVAQKRKGGAQANTKGVRDLGRIRADYGEVAIVHAQIILQFHEVPHLARAFGSPVPTVETQDKGKTSGEFGEPHGLLAMVW